MTTVNVGCSCGWRGKRGAADPAVWSPCPVCSATVMRRAKNYGRKPYYKGPETQEIPVGTRKGRLVVMGPSVRTASGRAVPLKCDCGTERLMLKSNFMRVGSCGCNRIRHRNASGAGKSKEYRAWRAMMERCYNVNYQHYANYGGRGITVCDSWRADFVNFFGSVGKAPSPSHSLDRIDNDGNYEPGNCRWATSKQQANNRRNSVIIELNGDAAPIAEWACRNGIHPGTLASRLRKGWSPEKALTTPAMTQFSRGSRT